MLNYVCTTSAPRLVVLEGKRLILGEIACLPHPLSHCVTLLCETTFATPTPSSRIWRFQSLFQECLLYPTTLSVYGLIIIIHLIHQSNRQLTEVLHPILTLIALILIIGRLPRQHNEEPLQMSAVLA